MDDLTSYVSELMVYVMNRFFDSSGGDTWSRGYCVSSDGRSVLVTATFGGILTHEKGLNEMFDVSGQAGSAPCFTCLNIRNRWVTTDGVTTLKMWDPDRSKNLHTNDTHVWVKVRKLKEAAAGVDSFETNTDRSRDGLFTEGLTI